MFREQPLPEEDSEWSVLSGLNGTQRRRLLSDWPVAFRRHILPLIDERLFADCFDGGTGAPNKPARWVVGLLLLQHTFDLTDDEALGSFLFDLRFHVALDVPPDKASLCQKTLHNWRKLLREHDKARPLFESLTASLLSLLGLSHSRQRADSTHTCSAIARRGRLGLCCETARHFLRSLTKRTDGALAKVPADLLARYLKGQGQPSHFEDTAKAKVQRRLRVVGRDLYRLAELFANDPGIAPTEPYLLLNRALAEQFLVGGEPVAPAEGDEDQGEPACPVRVRPAKQVSSSSLQSPYDPQATYGVKGVGYEAHLVETCANKGGGRADAPELITQVELRPSNESDVQATEALLEDLDGRGLRPRELITDGNFTSAQVVLSQREKGTEVIGPVKGNKGLPCADEETLGDFKVDEAEVGNSRCPAGQTPLGQEVTGKEEGRPAAGRVVLGLAVAACCVCPMQQRCPASSRGREKEGLVVLSFGREEHCLEQRRRYQTTEAFAGRAALRSGSEATNSEMKRRHGLADLRVRGKDRVEQAVLLKAAACNVKRALSYWTRHPTPQHPFTPPFKDE